MADAQRPTFSLPPPAALREEAQRVGERGKRKGRPRRRFLAERQLALARALVPMAGVVAAATTGVALLDVGTSSFPPSARAVAIEASVAVALAIVAALAYMQKSSYRALIGFSIGAGIITTLGWGAACHETGGGASPFLLLIPLSNAAFTHIVPTPPRAAVSIGMTSVAAVAIATPFAPPYVYMLALLTAVTGFVVARARQAQAIRSFFRVERMSAALARMRRVQEQLIVAEKLEALRVLVGGMAHELNNALAISQASNQQAMKDLGRHVFGAAEAWSTPDGNIELAKGAITRSDGGLGRIKRTVDRLRRFAMAAEGTLEPADVGAMLDFALESAIGRARSGVIVNRVYDPNVGAIECHVSALAEALFQIARNAIEAMPGGGTIEARVHREGEVVVLSVSDQGRGIPADQLQRVFDPFFSRAPGKSAQKSGLGLSAVYGLVTALGGRVQIDSEVGRGTVVSISMPAKRMSLRPPAPV